MKECGKCGEIKDLTAFHKCSAYKDGLQYYCKECKKKYYTAKLSENRAKKREYHHANRERLVAEMQLRYHANRDSYKKRFAENYQAKKVDYINRANERRANKISATPKWADRSKIKAIYDVCSFFNEVNGYVKYHVDHKIPLKNGLVCGLHVHTNLQIIPAEENLSKNNRFEIE